MIKGDRIFWDLDGVLRVLSWRFHDEWPDTWSQQINGKGLCEHVDEDLSILLNAPETEYTDLARECVPLHIVSLQPDNWRKNTSKWFDIHLPDAKVKYVSKPEHKLLYLECGTRILIEDNPNYDSYENIILIDRPYNRHVSAPNRVTSPDQLRSIITKYSKEGVL